ncbi:MAG: YjdF family protein [Bacteroidaceae bacterium]|nr:YjdF family protein [Bacteroidaceae bacterium]
MTTKHTLTILFEDPFWIGLFERTEDNQMQVCKVTFGAEPTNQEVLEYVNRNWNQLKYSRPVETEVKINPRNPKRQLREARKQTQNAGIGTKSQQALKLQQEENNLERKTLSKAQREADKERKFELKQAKRKEKHRGH